MSYVAHSYGCFSPTYFCSICWTSSRRKSPWWLSTETEDLLEKEDVEVPECCPIHMGTKASWHRQQNGTSLPKSSSSAAEMLKGIWWEAWSGKKLVFLPCLSSRANRAESIASYFHRYFPFYLSHDPVLTTKSWKTIFASVSLLMFLESICEKGAILARIVLKNIFHYPWVMAISSSKNPRFHCSNLTFKLCYLAQALEIGQIRYYYTVPQCRWKRRVFYFTGGVNAFDTSYSLMSSHKRLQRKMLPKNDYITFEHNGDTEWISLTLLDIPRV